MGLAEIAGPTTLGGHQPLREGHDFTGQGELAARARELEKAETVRAPRWAVLAWQALQELEASKWSGRLAERWEQITAYQAELWGAYCCGRAVRRAGEARD
mgnify:CR=1 FL=1